MQIIRTLDEIRVWKNTRSPSLKVGFVPTMGYLHEGHLSLIRAAKQTSDFVVLSIFVNPLQFGEAEDFSKYPRNETRDLQLAKEAFVDLVFMPAAEEIYANPMQTLIQVPPTLTQLLCGTSRPGHFEGVATIVCKLFHLIAPHHAHFGVKDAQQIAVITQMVKDLNFEVNIHPEPIVREKDGLAMSSRNVRLSAAHRLESTVLFETLTKAKKWAQDPTCTVQVLREKMKQMIFSTQGEIDYIEIVSYPSFQKLEYSKYTVDIKGTWLIGLAVKFGGIRLIDNCILGEKK